MKLHFAKRLRELRKEKGLSQVELGEHLATVILLFPVMKQGGTNPAI